MQRRWQVGFAVLAALGIIAGIIGPATAADSPFAGNWKVTVLSNGQEITINLIKVGGTDGKPEVSVVTGLPNFKDATVKDVSADAQSLHFTLEVRGTPFAVTAYATKDEPKPNFKKLLGTVLVRGQTREPVQMEPTDLTELTQKDAVKSPEGNADLRKALGLKDAKERETALQEIEKTHAGKSIVLLAAQARLQVLAKEGEAAEVKAAVEKYLKAAAVYGPELEEQVTYPSLKTLVKALHKDGKKEEAKEVEDRLAKIDEQRDKEFAKKALPFKPETFTGRKGKSQRVVVVELFTGAQCPPCVGADLAFDGAIKSYKPDEVVLLQYHLHIPGPDPLTNADSEARQKFYDKDIQGTPTMFINGKVTEPMGGFAQHARERYDTLRKLLDEAVERDAGGSLKLDVKRTADKIDLKADVSDLKNPGDKVRLRFVVIEDVVRYAGRNGQRLHHHVVRALPGGAGGFALTKKTSKQTATLSIKDLNKSLTEYLDKSNENRPFLDDERPLAGKHLKVVALIQDDETKQILQAAQADLMEEK